MSTSDLITTPISPGELVDKITILQIKSEQISDTEKRSNVLTELKLLEGVQSQHIPDSETLNALTSQLKDINQTLWNIEDDIRDCERNNDFSDTFTQLARSVYITNDKRAAVKKEINTFLGSTILEEKSYSDY